MKKTCVILAMLLTIISFNLSCSKMNVEMNVGYNNNLRIKDERNLSEFEYTFNNICATDDYGRVTYSSDSKKTDKERYVGMFYFLLLGLGTDVKGTYNVTQIINKYGIEAFGEDSDISPLNANHVWGEPVWGYYNAMDTWVMRKQIEMFTMAGIDFLIFDCSNAVLYESVTSKLLPILLEYQTMGFNVPKIMYMLNGGGDVDIDEKNLNTIYDTYYVNKDYSSLWFSPEGKPMVIINERTATRLNALNASSKQKTLASYFNIRYSQWPIADEYRKLGFPWMDFSYPQSIYTDAVNVSTAQHITVRFSDMEGSRGRGWNYKTEKNEHSNFGKNINFENQWNTVFENDDKLKYVLVTGWNEWSAQKMYMPQLTSTNNGYMMCDTFNDEYSRDIEPTKENSLKDNNYVQLIRKIKEYKYFEPKHYKYPSKSIDINNFENINWASASVYKDFIGECEDRYWLNYSGLSFNEDYSGRNDIDTISILKDKNYLYFRVSTVTNITSYEVGDTGWMNIWIKTKNVQNPNSMGYNYVINRKGIANGKSVIMKAESDNYIENGMADIAINDKVMQIRVPLSALCLGENNYDIEFKVTDNIQGIKNVLNYYSTGDSAPIGRLNYKYGY